ncbi:MULTISPECIES: hypothetical protein [Desulfitobacterium]|uniref:Uncharacterized protein n=1 Tax=Desulfitobacterium dehalogenans (strain ATCC 51507 / DSM 9161 / JW/IU-DC1) TaxID=756499 RepID=I4A821_DESDJ|nr:MULTISPECIES: hypothetical protein [Desulfitobacterium]AFM00106.1 hypothetical protein Desde_1705 [Desulfitobacterium dehalogenans ATCC 51507]
MEKQKSNVWDVRFEKINELGEVGNARVFYVSDKKVDKNLL